MTEYLDVVNQNDQVIGCETREKVHRAYLIHRGVHILVVNDSGCVLVQRRAESLDYYPGYLDASAGGQVASGESYEQAAGRELKEEIGCHDGPLTLIASYDGYSVRQREKRRVFLHSCRGPFRTDPGIIASIDFFPVERIVAMLPHHKVTEGFQRSLSLYLDYLAAQGTTTVRWRWTPAAAPSQPR